MYQEQAKSEGERSKMTDASSICKVSMGLGQAVALAGHAVWPDIIAAARPLKTYEPGRRCVCCGKPLSIFNAANVCSHPCQPRSKKLAESLKRF